jgi:ribose 5-phosphate isomerase A
MRRPSAVECLTLKEGTTWYSGDFSVKLKRRKQDLGSAMTDQAKQRAGEAAAALVEPGMRLGLGTGSTAAWFVRALGDRVKQGLLVKGVPTSEATARLAREVGVPLEDPEGVTGFDLTVDGADEFDPLLRLIKGGGGALLREKIVAAASDRVVIVADAAKRVDVLGHFPLPVEVTRFGWSLTARHVKSALLASNLGDRVVLRVQGKAQEPFISDGGNYILDCACGAIPDPEALGERLSRIAGVVEHGLFVGLAHQVIIGHSEGVKLLDRN